jgi:predicted nucleic acid binding AN1-type Zn finger protein
MEVQSITPPLSPVKLTVPDAPKKKKKKKKNKCPCVINGENCTKQPSLAVGYCKWCDITFCSSCRMPEVHKCPNLDKLKESKKLQNSNQLNNHKCHVSQLELQSRS